VNLLVRALLIASVVTAVPSTQADILDTYDATVTADSGSFSSTAVGSGVNGYIRDILGNANPALSSGTPGFGGNGNWILATAFGTSYSFPEGGYVFDANMLSGHLGHTGSGLLDVGLSATGTDYAVLTSIQSANNGALLTASWRDETTLGTYTLFQLAVTAASGPPYLTSNNSGDPLINGNPTTITVLQYTNGVETGSLTANVNYATPIPGAAWLLISGLAGLAALARKRGAM
jgi:hypothetical protein